MTGQGWTCCPGWKCCDRRHHYLCCSCDCSHGREHVLDPGRHCQGDEMEQGVVLE
jgi:hypothetical protein